MTYSFYKNCFWNKAFISNFLAALFMVAGIALVEVFKSDEDMKYWNMAFYLMRGFGIFGFAGGITNWMAIQMLFNKIPFIIGSGMLLNHFGEIRDNVRRTTMETYFNPVHLSQYVAQKTEILLNSFHMDSSIRNVVRSPTVQILINEKIEDIFSSAEGLLLGLVIDKNHVKESIIPFLENIGSDLMPLISQFISNSEHISEDRLRSHIDKLISSKIREMKTHDVISVVKSLVSTELGWLVVWGNIIGGLLGTALELAAVFKG